MSSLQESVQRLPRAMRSRVTVGVFAFLTLSSLIPVVISIYASPVLRLLFLPSYLVTMLLYDSVWGLENLVYLLGDGHLLWETGNVLTYYLFALAVGWLTERVRDLRRPPTDPELTS